MLDTTPEALEETEQFSPQVYTDSAGDNQSEAVRGMNLFSCIERDVGRSGDHHHKADEKAAPRRRWRDVVKRDLKTV